MKDVLLALQSIGLAGPAGEVPFFTDEPKYPSFFYSRGEETERYPLGQPYGLSLAEDAPSARTKALAEFYERLCLYNVLHDAIPRTWHAAAGWLDPAALVADPTPSLVAQLRQSSYVWLDAARLSDASPAKMPAQAVIPGFGLNEERIPASVTTAGAALGLCGEGGALERGLFEVLERHISDNTSTEERLQQQIVGLPPHVLSIEATLRRYSLEPYLFRLPAKCGAPCVLGILADRSGVGPALSLAVRAAPTFDAAIRTVLLEALERRRPARMEEANREPASDAPRAYPWEPLEALHEIEPLIQAAQAVPYSSLPSAPRTVQEVLRCLASEGLEAYSVDLTLPEVGAAGFEAVKIVVPGLLTKI